MRGRGGPTRRAVAAGLLASAAGSAARAAPGRERWIAYYGESAPAEAFAGFDLVVFDGESHPPLAGLASRGARALGYLSLGEAEAYRSDYERHRAQGLLVADNPLWRGHAVVDLRRPAWGRYVIEEAVPRLLRRGFDGVMLDTVDSPLDLERRDPARYGGMAASALALLRALRERHPAMTVMLNRGYEILAQAAPFIDAALAENVLTDWDPGEASPRRVPEAEVRRTLRVLRAARSRRHGLKLYALDYWPAGHPAAVKALYGALERDGLIAYIGDPDLQSVRPAPA